MNERTIHIISAGLAGLEAATNLAERGQKVVVYEAAAQAGGRCRSYFDTTLEMMIDNGNHLLLSGNHNALNYLRRIGSNHNFDMAGEPIFDFIDATTRQRWQLNINRGKLPFWLFNKKRRVPDTKPTDYLAILKLLKANDNQVINDVLAPDSVLYKRLWHPLLLSALNTHPAIASAKLAGEILHNTLLKGGKACVPLVAEHLSEAFINPALKFLENKKLEVHFNRRLEKIEFDDERAASLQFSGGAPVALATNDAIICAVPPNNINALLPEVTVPDEWRAILNAHFRIKPPPQLPRLLGVINGLCEWIFLFSRPCFCHYQ